MTTDRKAMVARARRVECFKGNQAWFLSLAATERVAGRWADARVALRRAALMGSIAGKRLPA